MLFCCFVRPCVKEARKCIFAVHESSARCANNCRASKPVALVAYFCGKTLQDFMRAADRVYYPAVSWCLEGINGLQKLFPRKQLLGHDGMRVAGDLQKPWPPLFLRQKALEVDSRNLIFAWVQHRMSHAILLLCTAVCQRGKKVYICSS